MCGICGVINFKGLTDKDLDYFKVLLLRSQRRGWDASGAAVQKLSYVKATAKASRLVKTKQFKNLLKKGRGQQWIIGHTRWATQGDPQNNKNNHPVTTMPGKFLLVHNGIVDTDKWSVDPEKSDTYAVARAVKRCWVKGDLFATVKDAYSCFWGSAAIAVITPKELVLARRERPLLLTKLSKNKYAFASASDFLHNNVYAPENIEFVDDGVILGFTAKGETRRGKLPAPRKEPEDDDEIETPSTPINQTYPKQWYATEGFEEGVTVGERDFEEKTLLPGWNKWGNVKGRVKESISFGDRVRVKPVANAYSTVQTNNLELSKRLIKLKKPYVGQVLNVYTDSKMKKVANVNFDGFKNSLSVPVKYLKKLGPGKGWWKESKRHSRAAKKGKR